MYFTPDGRYAVVMAERLRRIDFRDAHTMEHRATRSASRNAPGSTTPTSRPTGATCWSSCEFGARDDRRRRASEQCCHDGAAAARSLAPGRQAARLTAGCSTSPTWITVACGSRRAHVPRRSASFGTGAGAHGFTRAGTRTTCTSRTGRAGSISGVSFVTRTRGARRGRFRGALALTWAACPPRSTLWLSGAMTPRSLCDRHGHRASVARASPSAPDRMGYPSTRNPVATRLVIPA